MAKENFYGDWIVHDTSGTPFGIGATISIAEGSDVEVGFAIDGSSQKADYDAGWDAVIVTGYSNTSVMFISRYVDEENAFYGIYGLAIMGGSRRPAVFTAQAADQVPRPAGLVSSASIGGIDFDGFYTVRSTSGTQFGKGSEIEIRDDGTTMNITTIQGGSTSVPMSFDDTVCALKGTLTEDDNPDVVFQVSQASYGSVNYTYGLQVIGDPEEGGAWGGGDDDPGSDDPSG